MDIRNEQEAGDRKAKEVRYSSPLEQLIHETIDVVKDGVIVGFRWRAFFKHGSSAIIKMSRKVA